MEDRGALHDTFSEHRSRHPRREYRDGQCRSRAGFEVDHSIRSLASPWLGHGQIQYRDTFQVRKSRDRSFDPSELTTVGSINDVGSARE